MKERKDLMDINLLINQENEIAHNLIAECEELVQNTEGLITILSNIAEIKNKKAAAFYLLIKQVKNSMYLCLASSLRRHEVQAQLMLRHSIETACLAAYSLYDSKMENYIMNDEVGAKPVNNAKGKAYDWLDKNYPDQSLKLKQIKNQINEYYAHGNMFNSLRTISDKNANKAINYFDKKDLLLEKTYIWQVGYTACIIFDLIYQSSKKCDFVIVSEGVFETFKDLVEASQRYRLEFMQEERLFR